jgi:hypothetical protein
VVVINQQLNEFDPVHICSNEIISCTCNFFGSLFYDAFSVCTCNVRAVL